MPMDVFIYTLEYCLHNDEKIDKYSRQEIARIFALSNNLVDYKAFYTALESEAALYSSEEEPNQFFSSKSY